MRRFAFSDDINKLQKEYYDVVIIGSGIAGLYTALNLDSNLKCIILTKETTKVSSSYFAQGGIAAVTRDEDEISLHIKDTLEAGAGHCDYEAVKTLVTEGPVEINRLLAMGVPFDVNEDGDLMSTREGGHSMNRILHSGGDATGKELTKKLYSITSTKKNIEMRNNVFVSDILTYNNRACGVIAFDGEYRVIMSPNIIVCTGGIGQVYRYSTNPEVSTGDGVAACKRAGAVLHDMEFVQFHPTAFFQHDDDSQFFLISEAVRGEGGILKNKDNEAFMADKHPLKDLAPRDIVARAIFAEMKKTKQDHVYLDITSKSREFLSKRFPTIFEECLKKGIDISKDYIPVTPVQHYFMGGIKTDLHGMTNIDALYACGESACTGVHGANRLASNSLLECIVFGRRCAVQINEMKRILPEIDLNDIYSPVKYENKNTDFAQIKLEIKNLMTDTGGIVRHGETLKQSITELNDILMALEGRYLDMNGIEVLNMTQVATEILTGALNRKDSIGAHYRED